METRKLNILMRYPIKWGVYTVMNNFVQNFYDAVGPEKFATGFKMDYSDDTLTLEAESGFNKEWLYYLGASTKRDDGKHHAGHFGEGIKMAALVAYRDMKLGITMESQDWRLVVTQADQIINGVSEKILAYDLYTRPYSDTTKLTLTGVNAEQYKDACYTIHSFYYEENPRFANLITKADEYAVFKSNSKKKEGGVFINLEFRKSFPFPVYFCIHSMDIDKDDRDRITLSSYMMQRAIDLVLDRLEDPVAALEILEAFSPVWLTLQDAHHGCNWNYQIRRLIEIIANNKDVYNKFYEKYKDILLAEIAPSHPSDKNQRKIAFFWFQRSSYSSMRRVSHYFTNLGIKDLYTLCEENGGLDITASPNAQQSKRIRLLEEVADRFFSKAYCYEKLPTCNILINKNTVALGEACTHKIRSNAKNSFGVRVASEINEIYLAKEAFHTTLLKLSEDMLQIYGSNRSAKYNAVFTNLGECLLRGSMVIDKAQQAWEERSKYA